MTESDYTIHVANLIEQCGFCAMDLHFLCMSSLLGNVCCCSETLKTPVIATTPKTIDPFDPLNLKVPPKEVIVVPAEKKPTGKVGRPKKLIGEFDDQLAAGRKRALREFAIPENTTCEWGWRKYNGGGIKPVTGCPGRLAKHIHHGPDKSVLNNDRQSNISLVCTFCHQLWHARNDIYYKEPRPEAGLSWLPFAEGHPIHSLTESEIASPDEIMEFAKSIRRDLDEDDWRRYDARVSYLARSASENDARREARPDEDESQ